jgi:propanediol dehydratase large subunit
MSVNGRKMVWVKNVDKWANNGTGQRLQAYRMRRIKMIEQKISQNLIT